MMMSAAWSILVDEISGNSATGETLDFLIVGDGVDVFAISDAGVISVLDKNMLRAGDEYELNITVNGDSGIANRTTRTGSTITITASNQGPRFVESGPFELDEDDTDPAIILTQDTVIGTVVAEPNDNDSLTYSLTDDDFEIDEDTGEITAERDIDAPAAGGDFVKTVTVTVSDGVLSNNQDVDVTITIVANQAPTATSAVTDVGGVLSFSGTATVTSSAANASILDIATLVEDGDGDTLIASIEPVTPAVGVPTPLPDELKVDGGAVQLGNVPSGAQTLNYEFVLNVHDNFNPEGATDLAITVSLTITVEEVVRLHRDVKIPENTAGGAEITDLSDLILGTADYEAVGGDGRTRFSVDSDGKVTLNMGADLDVDAVGADTNYLLSVKLLDGNRIILGEVSVTITVTGVNEAPMFVATAPSNLSVAESAQPGTDVGDDPIVATDQDGDMITFSVKSVMTADGDPAMGSPFDVVIATDDDGNAMPGYAQIRVSGVISLANSPYTVVIEAKDNGDPMMSVEHNVTITLVDVNDPPIFDAPVTTEVEVREADSAGAVLATYNATDPDGNDIIEGLRYELSIEDRALFEVVSDADINTRQITGTVKVKDGQQLEYDVEQDSPAVIRYLIDVKACDALSACNQFLTLELTLKNSNDELPAIGNADDEQDVRENSPRGTSLGDYGATDKDNLNEPGFDTITYTLEGTNAKSFQISDTGELMTLESLDYDRPVPCRACDVTVVATDEVGNFDQQDVTINVMPVEDSISTVSVTKANPVPGTSMGSRESALFGTKTTIAGQTAVLERPSYLPATVDPAPDPMNYVETDWANWGTVLRIEVTAESPDENCQGGNRCVVINLSSDSADDELMVKAFRSADQENKFVAAVRLVGSSDEATSGDVAVYVHDDDVSVPAIRVDEEDEIEIEFGNLRASVDVENEAPEISNFAPEHEAAFDDADVDYSFTVTDGLSGLPEPEDLPDNNGNDEYTPVVALISSEQCETIKDEDIATDDERTPVLRVEDDEALYCPGDARTGEYIATGGGYGFAPIRDDKDFDEIDDGFDVETTIVLDENRTYYVTFVVCDNAGNCAFYDPDGNDDAEELVQITVDTEYPYFVEARTGLTWDSSDNEYDDNRAFVQVVFDDLTQLNAATVETDDFVVEGHTIKDVHVFENPDSDDVNWADSGRYADSGIMNERDIDLYQDLENSVFIELEDELLADETPDVTIVPNGVEDLAGNDQDGGEEDGDREADDWISPNFTILSIVSTRVTSQEEILAGEDDEVTVRVTTDERLDQTRPTVTVTYVNAESVDTKGVAACDDGDGLRIRGEVVNSDECLDRDAAAGGTLSNSVEKVSNTEWIITISEPDRGTGYYSFFIKGTDRSKEGNPGSEGIDPDDIVTDFFDSDGDVNIDDAVFFEGDRNLAKPYVRVSGMRVTDNEADVEYSSPLFVEIDFTRNHSTNCSSRESRDDLRANCTNENSEYIEDNFDDVIVTMFELDGVDLTDSVKTTDDQTFLVAIDNIGLGDHTAKIQAVDQAGNVLEDALEIDFEVDDRDPFEKRLSPGWNLVSLPGEPADSSIDAVFGANVEVRTVYTYDPVVPGGWMVAVRETLDSDWQGDLTEITGQRGYWVLSDAIQDWEVSIPRLAGGASGTGTPIQPPSIPLYAGWNLIPVVDVTGEFAGAYIRWRIT